MVSFVPSPTADTGRYVESLCVRAPVCLSLSLTHTSLHKQNRPRPLFKAVAFDINGDAAATVDARGHVVVFHLLKNRYEHLRHAGAAGSCIAFSTRRKSELFVGLEDNTVRPPPPPATLPQCVLVCTDQSRPCTGSLLRCGIQAADCCAQGPQAPCAIYFAQ